MKCAGADLHVVGLLDNAALVSPVAAQFENNVLKIHGLWYNYGNVTGKYRGLVAGCHDDSSMNKPIFIDSQPTTGAGSGKDFLVGG